MAILIVIIAAAVIVGAAYSFRQDQIKDTKSTIRIVVDQLPSQGTLPAVEILQPAFSSSSLNQVEDVTYAIRNNTTKGIISAVVAKTFVYQIGSRSLSDSSYSSFDYSLHPDMRTQRVLTPGNQMQMDSSPFGFEVGAEVKEIKLRIDYVEFDDNSAIGNGGEGERKITLMREGARRYKGLLVQRYRKDGQSIAKIIPLLESKEGYSALHLDDINLSLGADRYRLHLLKKLQTNGAPEVERFLK
ncbi:MAG TPA: hypothetical protein VJS64_18225 [Pyrinomonadaceae bacterium]|nr:hypothetical protein [Pyrinomonadaceae bacterium]